MVVQPRLGTSHALSDSRIRSIAEDKDGYIWIRTFSNTLLCYDSKLETVVDYAPQNTQKIFTQLMVASNGDVWIWGDKGCCRVRHNDGKLEAWTPAHAKLAGRPVSFIFEDSEHRIWVGGEKELFMVAHDKVNSMQEGTTFFSAARSGRFVFCGRRLHCSF